MLHLIRLFVIIGALLCAVLINYVWGHGMVLKPVNRSSRWRFNASAPINYNDNQLFCGGAGVQWHANNGQCGNCGDDFRDPTPRPNEIGGLYGEGIIVESYTVGSVIPVSILITANHLGFFKFTVCNMDANGETNECFIYNKIKLANGDDHFVVKGDMLGVVKMELKLPEDLTCKHCILQWTYVTANSWGFCGNGTGALGCGPQEHFRTCSDIRITDKNLDLETKFFLSEKRMNDAVAEDVVQQPILMGF